MTKMMHEDECRFQLSPSDPCQESWWMMYLPFCRELISFDPIKRRLVFEGRCYTADSTFPRSAPTRFVVRIKHRRRKTCMEVKIRSVQQGRDTSGVDHVDEDGLEICFFPSYIITMDYDLVREMDSLDISPEEFGHGKEYYEWKSGAWAHSITRENSNDCDDAF